MTIWKTLAKPHAHYELSSAGVIRLKRTKRDPKTNQPLRLTPPKRGGRGYTVQLRSAQGTTRKSICRLVGSLFLGYPPKAGIVYWKDGDVSNNAASNLGYAATHDQIPGLRPKGRRPRNNQGESWRPVCGYSGIYQVSSLGRVLRVCPSRRGPSYRLVGNSKPDLNGYMSVTLTKNGSSRPWLIHRLVAEAFIPRPNKKVDRVDHINGDPADNQVKNLRWVTHSENMAYAHHSAAAHRKKGLPPKTKPFQMPRIKDNLDWRPLTDWGVDGAYEVSSLGHVRRLRPTKGCRVGRVMSVRQLPSSYLVVKFRNVRDNRPITKQVHQVVAAAFGIDSKAADQVIHHINHIKTDNRPENLEWVSRRDNARLAVRAGRFIRNGKHVSATLSLAEATRLRELSSKLTRTELSKRFGITARAVDCVLKNETHFDARYSPQKAVRGLLIGEKHHLTDLSKKQVLEIVRLKREGLTHDAILRKCGLSVSTCTISNIVNGKTWGWLTGISPSESTRLIEKWDAGYTACCDWHKTCGSLANVRVSDTISKFPIGRWIDHRRQDRKNGILTLEQIRGLDELGVDWEPHENKFKRNMQLVRRFAADNGGLNDVQTDAEMSSPDHVGGIFKIGRWITMQRSARNKLIRKGKRASTRQAKCFDELTELGIEWNPKRGPKKKI